MGHEDEVDDMTIGLQMQQLMDEWYYRCIHSGLPLNMDRNQAAIIAMDILETLDIPITKEEKQELALLDEKDMIEELVRKMPVETRRTFAHFALQLQLVISAATHTRHALEENDAEEAVRAVEGESGIAQQILMRCVIESAVEVGELNELHNSWRENMDWRVKRLTRCHDDAERATKQMEDLKRQMAVFGTEQNDKSKQVLVGIAEKNDKQMLAATFGCWAAWLIRYRNEKDIHQKFQLQIEDAEKRLLEYKQKQLNNVRGVMSRKAADMDSAVLLEAFRIWLKSAKEQKEELELGEQMRQAQEKLASYKESQQANSKKVMMRMTANREGTLSSLCFQAWFQIIEDEKKRAELEEKAKEAEQLVAQYMENKSAEAKKVLNRMCGSGEKGLLISVRAAWIDMWKTEKREREMDEAYQRANDKFHMLSKRQKNAVKNNAERTIVMEEENLAAQIFMNWAATAVTDRIVNYYSGKLDSKNHQLEAVQSMFKSFATQLEQGISTTPRTTRRSKAGGSGATKGSPEARPPTLPSPTPAQ